MLETKRVALARYAARGKQYLVLLRPVDGGIVMQQLYYADEVRPFSEVPLEPAEVTDKELDLAKLLVDQRATEKFAPETYEDDVKKRVLGLIQKKVDGQEISLAPPEAGGGQIIDLMEALKASLAKKPEAAAASAASFEGRARPPTRGRPRASPPSAPRRASPRCARNRAARPDPLASRLGYSRRPVKGYSTKEVAKLLAMTGGRGPRLRARRIAFPRARARGGR